MACDRPSARQQKDSTVPRSYGIWLAFSGRCVVDSAGVTGSNPVIWGTIRAGSVGPPSGSSLALALRRTRLTKDAPWDEVARRAGVRSRARLPPHEAAPLAWMAGGSASPFGGGGIADQLAILDSAACLPDPLRHLLCQVRWDREGLSGRYVDNEIEHRAPLNG